MSFEQMNGRIPMEEGLQALVTNPDPASLPNWRPILGTVPNDPWSNPYRDVARAPEGRANWGFYSIGADGTSRSMGNDRDDESTWDPGKWRERDPRAEVARALSAIAMVVPVVWLLWFAGGSGKRRIVARRQRDYARAGLRCHLETRHPRPESSLPIKMNPNGTIVSKPRSLSEEEWEEVQRANRQSHFRCVFGTAQFI